MKVLEFHDLKPEDRLRLSFEAGFDPHSSLAHALEPLLQALETYAGDWMPDVVEGKRRRKYSRTALLKGLEEQRANDLSSVGLFRTRWPALSMMLSLQFPPHPLELSIWVAVQPLSFFADLNRCQRFVDLVCAWTSHYPVTHAVASSLAEDQLSGAPGFGRDMQTSIREGFNKIYEVSWLNVFGPKLVEAVGRERMLSTPAHRVEELPNGAILVVTWPTAADFASDEARRAQARAHVHLRPDLEFDTVLRTLRERSAALVPVAPRFPPDLEPLLSRVVDHVAISERQRKTAELNDWRPLEPAEWLPADAALTSDVKDPDLVCRQYDDLAEGLVALLHTDVPSVFETSPESLTDVDVYLWSKDFLKFRKPETVEEHLVPAVGAYLGEVLVKHLGGQWIPRQKLEEAQVRVGSRVWLPFVRAHCYLRSRQALLDFSLTQLYRMAELHPS